jgi:hypothetical protein
MTSFAHRDGLRVNGLRGDDFRANGFKLKYLRTRMSMTPFYYMSLMLVLQEENQMVGITAQ